MKCLILAAGYATRLYPLTENFPKPLLPVKGKAILDWILEDLDSLGEIEEYIVITNHRFAGYFHEWAAEHKQPIKVLDDGTESNETRLGAVRDLQLAIKSQELHDDLLVIAGDNLLDFSLCGLLDFQKEKGTSCVLRYRETNRERLKKAGVAEVDENSRIIGMQEKPAEPKSEWCTPPFYVFTKADLPLVEEGITAGCGVDAPGSFLAWLSGRTAVHAWQMPGRRYDIGDLKSYHLAQSDYTGILKK